MGLFNPGPTTPGEAGCLVAVLWALLFAGAILGLLAMLILSIEPIER